MKVKSVLTTSLIAACIFTSNAFACEDTALEKMIAGTVNTAMTNVTIDMNGAIAESFNLMKSTVNLDTERLKQETSMDLAKVPEGKKDILGISAGEIIKSE